MVLTEGHLELSDEENAAVEEFLEQLNDATVERREAVKFLMARKFVVSRALTLFNASKNLRKGYHLLDIDVTNDQIANELESGKFTVLDGKCDDNTTICLFYARKHLPKVVDRQTVLQSLVFQLDCIMNSMSSQRYGLTFIYNMQHAKYSNFDYDLAMKILNMLREGYPAMLKRVCIICPPIWFRASMTVLSLFLKDKIRERVEIIGDLASLHRLVDRSVLPTDMDGTSTFTHSQWIQQCLGSTISTPVANQIIITPPTPTDPLPEKSADDSGPPAVGPVVVDYRTKPLPPSPPPSDTEEDRNEMEDVDVENEEEDLSSDTGQLIEEFLQRVRVKGKAGIHAEYEKLRVLPVAGTFESTLYRGNAQKNRYNNIMCLEETRVLLNEIDGDPISDYINANYVGSPTQEQKFICTQGPTPQTFADFWRMLWEQHVCVVVMITRCVERGRTKCGQYWPEHPDERATHGDLIVTNVSSDVKQDFTSTLFQIYNEEENETRDLYHIQFTGWPDFGVLSSAEAILEVNEHIELYQNECDQKPHEDGEANGETEDKSQVGENSEWADKELTDENNAQEFESVEKSLAREEELAEKSMEASGEYATLQHQEQPKRRAPIVVHCSAGVGRTGTFCCLHNSVEEMEHSGTVDVFQTVRRIREQRAFSVQTPEQYEFCYAGVLEYLMRRDPDQGDRLQRILNGLRNATSSDEDSGY